MNKLTLTFFLFVLTSLATMSQEQSYELKETEKYKDKLLERNAGFEFIGKDKDACYYLFLPYNQVFGFNSIGSNRIPYIGKYDKDLNLEKRVEANIKSDGKEREYRGVVYLNNTIYLITSFLNSEHKKHYFFVQSVNTSTLEDNNDLRKIGEIDYAPYNKYKETSFNIELSEDKSKVLIYTNILNRRGNILNSSIYSFDDKFNLKWHKESIGHGFTSGLFIAREFNIDNVGNIYITGLYYKDRKPDGYLEFKASKEYGGATYYPEQPVYEYAMFYYYNSGKSSKTNIIKLPGKFIRELTIKPLVNNQVFCAGIYSKPGMISPEGFSTFKFNAVKGTVTSVHQKGFGPNDMESGFDEKTIKKFQKKAKNDQEWDPFIYKCKLEKRSKGGYICIAERFLDGMLVSNNGKTVTYTPVWHYTNILAFTISKDYKIERMDVVNKTQYTVNYNWFSSYNFTEYNNKLYFVFNEFVRKNSFLGLGKIAAPTEFVMVEIDQNGKKNRNVIKTYPSKFKEILFMRNGSGGTFSSGELVYAVMTVNLKYYGFNKITIN